ncbi:hypothetical protein BJX61DRAFT_506060 [Aspergillus egyptiacus]|nr:hypothetical protein BJX61DRAFT_506060 [Aspergillus egyptiacus]
MILDCSRFNLDHTGQFRKRHILASIYGGGVIALSSKVSSMVTVPYYSSNLCRPAQSKTLLKSILDGF